MAQPCVTRETVDILLDLFWNERSYFPLAALDRQWDDGYPIEFVPRLPVGNQINRPGRPECQMTKESKKHRSKEGMTEDDIRAIRAFLKMRPRERTPDALRGLSND